MSEDKIDIVIEKKPKLRKGCFVRILKWGACGGMVFFALCYYCFWRSVPMEISPETTVITEPLTAAGQVDYFAYLESRQPKNIASDENGYRVVYREVGPGEYWRRDKENNSPELLRQFYEKLDLDADAEPPHPLFDHYSAWNEWAKTKYSDLSDEELQMLGPAHGGNDFEGWFDAYTDDRREFTDMWAAQNSPALDIIARELQKETFAWPMLRQSENEPLVIALLSIDIDQEFRSWARELRFRAYWRLHNGDVEGALGDTLAMKRLARAVKRHVGGCLIHQLVAIALDGMATGTAIGSNPNAPPTREQWQALMDDATENRDALSFSDALAGERFQILDMLQRCGEAQKGLFRTDPFRGETVAMPSIMSVWPGADWNRIARRFNALFGHMENFNPDLLADEMREIKKRSLLCRPTLAGRTEWLCATLVELLCPAFDAAFEASRREACFLNLAKLDYAMQLYACDHDGLLPPAYTVDSEGRALHSWRVLILPYLGPEAKALYNQIKLDEPWDSEANKRFHQRHIAEYVCPSALAFQNGRTDEMPYPKTGETTYSVIVGPDTRFGTDGVGRAVNSPEKSSEQILIIERRDPICWMKPDAEITQEAVVPKGFHVGGTNAALANAGVQFISEDASENAKEQFDKWLLGKGE